MENSLLIQVLAWTCAVVFISISIITILALIGKVKFQDERYLKGLFSLLIVEVIGVGILAFKYSVSTDELNCEDCVDNRLELVDTIFVAQGLDRCIIYNPIDTLYYEAGWDNIFLYGVYQTADDNVDLKINFRVNEGNWQIIDSSLISLENGLMKATLRHTPDSTVSIMVKTFVNDVEQPIHNFIVTPF